MVESANENRAVEGSFDSAHASEKKKSKVRVEQEARQTKLTAPEEILHFKHCLPALVSGRRSR